jgi:hypothetical protein
MSWFNNSVISKSVFLGVFFAKFKGKDPPCEKNSASVTTNAQLITFNYHYNNISKVTK